MNNVSNNREYRLKLFAEKIYNSKIKIENKSKVNNNEKISKQLNNSNNNIANKKLGFL